MSVELELLPSPAASLETQKKAQAVVREVADAFSARLAYTLPYPLKLQFIEDLERPNDYLEHIMVLSLYRGDISVGEKTHHVELWAFDKTVIAHEFAHFVFWDLLASEGVSGVSAKARVPGGPNTEFHMVQEGFCDYMSAVITGTPAIGAKAFTPPLRDLTDWDFRAHARGVSPQFMGWGPFLWWLHTHIDVPGVALEKVVLESLKYLQRGDGLDAAVGSLQRGCESLYKTSDCAHLQAFIQTAYLELFVPALES